MAAKADSSDPTLGGALPDPADDSPRGRFNRGEITFDELEAFYRDAKGAEHVNPAPVVEDEPAKPAKAARKRLR